MRNCKYVASGLIRIALKRGKELFHFPDEEATDKHYVEKRKQAIGWQKQTF